MPTRVLVTGASGFIGRATCAALTARGFDVYGLSRRPRAESTLTWFVHDQLADNPARLLRDLQPDVLVHLGWVAPPADYRDHPDNLRWVERTLDLANRARETGTTRQVFVGTSLESAPEYTVYGAAKHHLYEAISTGLAGTSWSWARPYLVYGPGEAPGRLIPTMARALTRNTEVALGPGEAIRDFIHVEDVAEALVVLCESDHRGPVDLGTGRAVSVADAARLMARLAGRPDLLRLGALPRRAEPPRLVADARLLRQLRAAPRIPLEVGLAEALNVRNASRTAA